MQKGKKIHTTQYFPTLYVLWNGIICFPGCRFSFHRIETVSLTEPAQRSASHSPTFNHYCSAVVSVLLREHDWFTHGRERSPQPFSLRFPIVSCTVWRSAGVICCMFAMVVVWVNNRYVSFSLLLPLWSSDFALDRMDCCETCETNYRYSHRQSFESEESVKTILDIFRDVWLAVTFSVTDGDFFEWHGKPEWLDKIAKYSVDDNMRIHFFGMCQKTVKNLMQHARKVFNTWLCGLVATASYAYAEGPG